MLLHLLPEAGLKFTLTNNSLSFLGLYIFHGEHISAILGISSKTLQRRASEWNIPTFSTTVDSELDDIVGEYMQRFPNCGEALIRGYLHSTGLHIQRSRVRESIHRIAGSQTSLHPPVFRRTYSVPGPNHLWHVDGNHKMIRWRLVIHGGIDGFSRLITYLKCSNNNTADTVSTYFVQATREYGVPSRVRSDHGGENVGIWRFMEEVRGSDRGSYIAGRSVHNTRIERLWRDVYTAVSSTFVSVFHYLEEENTLHPDNDTDLFCLHYVFIPIINSRLDAFRHAWNHHPLSTEGNHSPVQLYAGGSIGSALFNERIDLETYGYDPEDSSAEEEEESIIVIPPTDLSLSQASFRILQAAVDPLEECADNGIQFYGDCVHVVFQAMHNDGLVD